jgi:predicted Zn-dependent peptidase
LGGYFGSRLMSNIREDKGYTYGIGSAVAAYKNNGYFIISTEVGADVCASALKEIYLEIEKLCNDKVSEQELQTVKSFMLGDLLRDMDGPFALADRYKNMYLNILPDNYYPNFADAIKNISANEILSISQRYLAVNNLTELVVGKF